jgi:uncharacterized membrane protein YoaK (UPF0700 family)
VSHRTDSAAPERATQQSPDPLPGLLLLLTVITGIVDAISFLKLGRVFVANMTGNVVFLGFAVADMDFSILTSLVAIAAFLAGAFAGGRLGPHAGRDRARLLAIATGVEILLVGASLAIAVSPLSPAQTPARYAMIVLLAVTMGIQSATARRLGVPNLTTTVLTVTLAGLAADWHWDGGKQRAGRSLAAVGAMFLGAALGAIVIALSGVAAALGIALTLLAVTSLAAYRDAASRIGSSRDGEIGDQGGT